MKPVNPFCPLYKGYLLQNYGQCTCTCTCTNNKMDLVLCREVIYLFLLCPRLGGEVPLYSLLMSYFLYYIIRCS